MSTTNTAVKAYLTGTQYIEAEELKNVFGFLKNRSRRPKSNTRSIKKESPEEHTILKEFHKKRCGPKGMFVRLGNKECDTQRTYTLGKIKGVYKRNNLTLKKIRSANGERRTLYDYAAIGAFERMQYDTKTVPDKHALPRSIYEQFKHNAELPKYQWTVMDAKTKVRFNAWSYSLSSFFGQKFLELVIVWLRAHGVEGKISVQTDRGGEFFSGSLRKQCEWNTHFSRYHVQVYDTKGAKWKQNLVERSHRIDDEEFYIPRESI